MKSVYVVSKGSSFYSEYIVGVYSDKKVAEEWMRVHNNFLSEDMFYLSLKEYKITDILPPLSFTFLVKVTNRGDANVAWSREYRSEKDDDYISYANSFDHNLKHYKENRVEEDFPILITYVPIPSRITELEEANEYAIKVAKERWTILKNAGAIGDIDLSKKLLFGVDK